MKKLALAFTSTVLASTAHIVAYASVALVPGVAPVALPGTTAAAEADLAGVVVEDNVLPFSISNAAGALLFEGKLQNRVVRSSSTGDLHFYYRVRDTTPGLNGIVKNVVTTSFQAMPRILADWRIDGLGNINPVEASRSSGLGHHIQFAFDTSSNVLVGGAESKFFFVKTHAQKYKNTGKTRIVLTTGDSTVLKTFVPVR